MSRARWSAFTLLELLIVAAILAVLVAILVPSLSAARENARAIVCAANTRSLAQGAMTYAEGARDRLPPSYVAADLNSTEPVWDMQPSEGADRPLIHWTRMTLGFADRPRDRVFSCPSVPDGGAPPMRAAAGDLELWQRSAPPPPDWQPTRLAYTVNGAIMPPGTMFNHWPRATRLVALGEIQRPEATVVVTEFHHDPIVGWRGIAEDNRVSRSHRPIMPFVGGSSGAYSVYSEPNIGSSPRFFYPTDNSIFTVAQIGRMNQLFGVVNLITSDAVTSLNAVGRTHPGPGSGRAHDGRAANLALADGHVERMHVRQTLERRLWGDRFWGITGNNAVDPAAQVDP